VVRNERRKRVIVVDRHSLLGEHFARLGADHLISSEFNRFPIERLKLDWLGAQGLLQGNLVVVDQIVSRAGHLLTVCLVQGHDEVALALEFAIVSFVGEAQGHALLHAWLNENVFSDTAAIGLCNQRFVRANFLARAIEAGVLNALSGSIEEFLQRALHIQD